METAAVLAVVAFLAATVAVSFVAVWVIDVIIN